MNSQFQHESSVRQTQQNEVWIWDAAKKQKDMLQKNLPKVLLSPKHGTCWTFLATSAGTSLLAPILFTFSAACSLLGKGEINDRTLESSESLPEESEFAKRPRKQT